jgi:hemerythrin
MKLFDCWSPTEPTEVKGRTGMGEWISWQPDLTINVAQIDEQHKELFRQFNLLGDAVWDGKGKDSIGQLLSFLADYTVKHFSEEEALMETVGYPDYAVHKQAHRELVAEVSDFIGKFQSGEVQSALLISVVNRLGEWTRQHIRGMDQGLGQYVTSRQ